MLKQITQVIAKYIFPVAAKLARATTINCGIGWIYASQIDWWNSIFFQQLFFLLYLNAINVNVNVTQDS